MKDASRVDGPVAASLHKNFAFLAASYLLAPLFSMVLVLAISRLRGVEELGKYSLVMTIFVLGQSCAGFGLPLVITREVAQAHTAASRYFSSACAVTLGLLVPILALTFPILRSTMADRELCWAIYLVLVALLVTCITVYGEAVLLAFERAGDFVAINLGETVLRAVMGTVLVLAGYGVAAIAAGLLALRIVAAGAYVVALGRRGVRLDLRPDLGLCRTLLGYVPVVGFIPIVNALYARMDVFLLTALGSWAEVGLYSAAMRFIDLARTIPLAYARALYPVLARRWGCSEIEYRTVTKRGLRTALLIISPVSLMLSGVGGPVLTFLYGPSLAAAIPSLQVLAWTLMPLAVAVTLAQVLFSANRQAIDLRVNLIASVVSLAANLVLIPRFGATGAAVGTLLSTSAYAALQYFWTNRHVIHLRARADLARIMSVTVGSSAAMAIIAPRGMWVTAAIGLLCYGVGLVVVGLIQREDLARVRLLAASSTGSLR